MGRSIYFTIEGAAKRQCRESNNEWTKEMEEATRICKQREQTSAIVETSAWRPRRPRRKESYEFLQLSDRPEDQSVLQVRYP